MEAKKAGLIGCGNISDAYLNGAALYQALDIVACADIAPEVAAAKAAAYGIAAQSVDDLLADPELDFVINLTVPNAHADVTLAALAAGRHVYCEKPLAVTLADGRKIAAAAEAAGLRVGCAPDTFLGGAHQRARRLIDEGAIGRPVAATAVFLSPGMESWHPNPTFFFKAGGGPILDVGPYYVATLINLMGPVRRVSASSTITFAERTVTSEGAMNGTKITVEVPTLVSGAMEFESGAIATILMSWDVKANQHNRIEVYGSEGSMVVPDPNFFGGDCLVTAGGRNAKWQAVPPGDLPFAEPNWPPEDPRVANYRIIGAVDMAYALQTGRPHRLSLEFALHTLEVMEGLVASGDKGVHVDMESTCERPAPMPAGTGEATLRAG